MPAMYDRTMKCKTCGQDVHFEKGKSSARCIYCDTINYLPTDDVNPEGKKSKEVRADEFRVQGNFGEAERLYNQLVADDKESYDARWGSVLCRYGAIYEKSIDGKWTYTSQRIVEKSILGDADYLYARDHCPEDMRAKIEEKARYIDAIQSEMRKLLRDPKPCDIFLSCNPRAIGYVAEQAEKLYNVLKKKYGVFYAPKMLSAQSGPSYEAAVEVAIERARVMIVLGTTAEDYCVPWVRSEWRRFWNDLRGRKLIFLYANDGDLPETIRVEKNETLIEKYPVSGFTADVQAKTLENALVYRCPECLKELKKYKDHIGYCPQHKKWVAVPGYNKEKDADEKNAADEKRRKLRKRLTLAATLLVILVAAGAFWLIVRPGLSYSQAATKFALGDYQAAKEEYAALGNYKDALARVVLCDAMVDLQEGRTEETVKKLDQLTADGMEEITRQLADALLPVMSGWRSRGLTPHAMLLLLTKADIIDPAGTLDRVALRTEAHKALLDAKTLSSYAADVNGDGDPELIALNDDYTVTVYRMTDSGNLRMAAEAKVLAECALRFGEAYSETDENSYVACCSAAYHYLPDAENRSALVKAYRFRADSLESEGNLAGAAEDAERALALSGDRADFDRFYAWSLQLCGQSDTADALTAWYQFADDSAALLAQYQAQDQWRADAAQLHLRCAAELVAQNDGGFVQELSRAAALGADITEAAAQAEEQTDPGLALINLRLLALNSMEDAAKAQALRDGLAEEVRSEIADWQTRGVRPAEVPALIRLAAEQEISLEGIDERAVYQEAMVVAAGSQGQTAFADLDQDGYEELLTLDKEGTLLLCGLGEITEVLSSVDTEIPGGSFTLTEPAPHSILVLSQNEEELLALSTADRRLIVLFRETELCHYTQDVSGDGIPELIALNADHSVSVYRLLPGEDTLLRVDQQTLAACALRFGALLSDTDADLSVACYEMAYDAWPDDETRSALTEAYRSRARALENEDLPGAVRDADAALRLSDAAEDFDFYYSLQLRSCQGTEDAVAAWDQFARAYAGLLAQYQAQGRWQDDAARLRLHQAETLAARSDEGCIEAFRAAAALGADVFASLAKAKEYFDPGLFRMTLGTLQLELSADEVAAAAVRTGLSEEIAPQLSDWKKLGIAPEDVLSMLLLADQGKIELPGVGTDALYREAALATVNSPAQTAFADIDGDGYSELIALDKNGKLSLYGMSGSWGVLSMADTQLPGASFELYGQDAAVIAVLSAQEDQLLTLTAAGNRLHTLFREAGICRYAVRDAQITYSRKLEDSITRYIDYSYDASAPENKPLRAGIDWQQAAYPYPDSAAAAVRRYFEALNYDIPEEAALLTAEASSFSFFRMDALPQTPVPTYVEAQPYCLLEDTALLEVTYSAAGHNERIWAAVENVGTWKVAGFARTFAEGMPGDLDGADTLMSLNDPVAGALKAKGETRNYRMLVPASGRFRLVWKGADRKREGVQSYHVIISPVGSSSPLLNVNLAYTTDTLASNPMFIDAGAYTVSVTSLLTKAPDYQVTMEYAHLEHVEEEKNNSAAEAMAIALNTAYSGVLSNKDDVDYYAFTLEETSSVNVTLAHEIEKNSSTVYYTCALLEATYETALSVLNVSAESASAGTGSLYLAPGNYLVRVAKGTSHNGAAYTLMVSASAATLTEAESNCTFASANSIPLDTDITGSCGLENDVDYFSFTLEEDALVRLRLSFQSTGSSARLYRLTLLDGSRSNLMSVNISGRDYAKKINQIALPAGQYYIRLESALLVRQDYKLRVEALAVEAVEQEPNNTEANAVTMQIGTTYTGLLSSDEDADFFKLILTGDTLARLLFIHPETTENVTKFSLTIIPPSGSNYTRNIKGNEGALEEPVRFPAAGTYYIRIRPASSWSSEPYTICVEPLTP